MGMRGSETQTARLFSTNHPLTAQHLRSQTTPPENGCRGQPLARRGESISDRLLSLGGCSQTQW